MCAEFKLHMERWVGSWGQKTGLWIGIVHSSSCILLCFSTSLGIIFVKVVCTIVYLFCCMEFHCMSKSQFIYPFHFNNHMVCA